MDDLIYTESNTTMFESFKKSMMAEFEMSDLGMMHYFLRIEVLQSSTGIFIFQKKYVGEILDKFQMKDCNLVNTPSEFGLKLNKDEGGNKVNRDFDDRKSTSEYVLMLETGAISWSSKKQPIVTLSTTEAEFVAATAYACQAIWLKKILEKLLFKEDGPTLIYCDNSSAIKLSKNHQVYMYFHGSGKAAKLKREAEAARGAMRAAI
ncbi:uncharacterized protein LOC120131793 [Hibiscus syriacus]|uniref:uncharacterized protein LOC120131793 n=1 Tax=Hibiscus syriacus TaxID=106335 RepID=UPI0019238323|nr:uncharacterized protein LOC120131793 [Hibiscus syriacus]